MFLIIIISRKETGQKTKSQKSWTILKSLSSVFGVRKKADEEWAFQGRKGRKEQIFFRLWKAADEKCVYAAVGQVGRAQRHGCGPRGSATRWCTNKQWLRAPEPNWTQQARVGRCDGTKIRNSKCSHMDGRQNLIGETKNVAPWIYQELYYQESQEIQSEQLSLPPSIGWLCYYTTQVGEK